MTTRSVGNQIPVVRQGEPITADLFNRLAAIAVRGGRIRVGPGLTSRAGSDGIIISIDFNQLANRWGWMTARISAVSGGAGPAVASTFTYSVIVEGRADLPEYTNLTPAMGRPVASGDSTTEILPAAVDDSCAIRLRKNGDGTTTAELWIGTETLAFEDCGSEALAQAQSLSTLTVLDTLLADANGNPLSDGNGNPLGSAYINAAQATEYLDCVLTDANGNPLSDANGNVLLTADATEDAVALWDCVLTDANGNILTDANGNPLLSADALAIL